MTTTHIPPNLFIILNIFRVVGPNFVSKKAEEESEEKRDIFDLTPRPEEKKQRKQKPLIGETIYISFAKLRKTAFLYFSPSLARVFVFCSVLQLEKSPQNPLRSYLVT